MPPPDTTAKPWQNYLKERHQRSDVVWKRCWVLDVLWPNTNLLSLIHWICPSGTLGLGILNTTVNIVEHESQKRSKSHSQKLTFCPFLYLLMWISINESTAEKRPNSTHGLLLASWSFLALVVSENITALSTYCAAKQLSSSMEGLDAGGSF